MSSSVIRSLLRFIHVEAAGGMVLVGAAAIALLWANSPWSASYTQLWQATVPIGIGPVVSMPSLQFLIDEGLMSAFFLVVGLEIRRELHSGALSDRGLAALPLVAALGGMVAPALIYLAI
ncbi:MAG TPA: Na+/H+ antiporter NhaA, partial [Steroidobacteraceae bacterium]|nr:Na+/H+ antiporter NhaA [Steroidobacteraceae bacterium]